MRRNGKGDDSSMRDAAFDQRDGGIGNPLS
jgi:hypothetical protein